MLYMFHYEITGIYSRDADVWLLTAKFLIFALFFQLSAVIAAPIQGA